MKVIRSLCVNFSILGIILILIVVLGCSSSKFQGYGNVEKEKKLGGVDYKPEGSTLTGGLIGAGTGAVIGGGAGAISGGVAGAVIGAPTIILAPVTTVGSVVVGFTGGVIVGSIIGVSIGAGGGYVYGIHEQGLGIYYFEVTQEKVGQSSLEIHQNISADIAPGTKVKIYKDVRWGYPAGYHIVPAN